MKTKVIAFRVTEEEQRAIRWAAGSAKVDVGRYLRDALALTLDHCVRDMNAEVKRLEAKAKRAAKKAAAAEVVPGD